VNLAILIGHFPPGAFGGAELQAQGWAERLCDRHRVTVVTRRDPPGQPAHEARDGYRVIRLPVSRVPLLRTALDLARIERAVARLPVRPDLLLCFQTFVSGWAGVRIQRRLGIPALVWIRGEGEYRLAGSPWTRMNSRAVWREARGVLVQSERNRRDLLAELGRVSATERDALAGRIDVVPNGLDLPQAVSPPGPRILSVGRLIPDKGMDVVIDAVAGMQGLLTIAGAGPERARLEARARAHDLDVRFTGFVASAALAELYRGASCVVLGARRGEGLPNVVLEAMAHGRAVVATRVAGAEDLIDDGVTGLLVPPGDPLALRDALARLAHERGLAARLGAAARAVAERHAWDRVRGTLEAVLERGRSR
jgi:glycosyltransferase involved in cell wall biosynthesis